MACTVPAWIESCAYSSIFSRLDINVKLSSVTVLISSIKMKGLNIRYRKT